MRRFLISTIATVVCTLSLAAQPVILDLWPDGAPNDNGLKGPERQLENGRLDNVTHPTLTVYPAAKPNGTAVIMCPGGGYIRLAMNHEGHDMANWFNNQGVTYAVLKYRMPNGNIDVPVSDGLRAVKLLREHAAEWGISRVGIMGASAGGNLATQVATQWTKDDERPDFQVLFYAFTGAPRDPKAMFGTTPSQERLDKYTTYKQVNSRTPQAFIMCSADDTSVPYMNSVQYFQALREAKVPATMHIYPSGGHGWGFNDSFIYKREWTAELERWLLEIAR